MILIAIVVLVLFGAKKIPEFRRGLGIGIDEFQKEDLGRHTGAGLGKPVADALTHSNQTAEFQDPPTLRPREIITHMRDTLMLWIAQGFGAGRAPFAPGTFGSVVGLGWFALLLAPGNPWLFLAGTLAGVILSAWLCGEAERILVQRDPASVVLDEIIAIPLCFGAWVGLEAGQRGALPPVDFFFVDNALLTLGVFLAFRFFDVVKPWPIRQSQSLPGGWGVTVDDVLAAVGVNLLVLLVWFSAR